MPRNVAGVYTLPPGYLAVTGQTIEASQHNPPLEDIAAALTDSLPRSGVAPMLGTLSMGGNRVANLGTPTAPADAATKAYIDAAVASLTALITVPPGTVALWPGDTVPTGWIAGSGQIVSRTTYAGIFAAYGTKYGTGDGTTTFGLPDLRGEFPRFADLGRGADPGRVNGTTQADEIESHAHGVADNGHTHEYQDHGTDAAPRGANEPAFTQTTIPGFLYGNTSVGYTGIVIQATGGSETRPRNIALIGIIKI